MNGFDNLDNETNQEETNQNSTSVSSQEISHGDFEKLKAVHDFHKKKVQKNIHQAMSPISAISGYLELMKMILQNDGDVDKIERYREKINEGVNELEKIIEELHKVFDDSDEKIADTEALISALETHRRAS